MSVQILKRGDLVQTWFDTGAMGAQILYGRVIKAGPKRYEVIWESSLRNRIEQGSYGVVPASNQELAEQAMQKALAPPVT